jgi:3-phosphoshikimate 1-carboxyvinyltransferase
MKHLDLAPVSKISGTLRLPGSKSISNRVLLLSALAKGKTQVRGLLDADDTRVMLDALQKLDVRIDTRDFSSLVVAGEGRFAPKKRDLFLGNAGTAFRPLTAALAVCGGEYRLMGKPRMHERPIRDLVEPLRSIGASIEYTGNEGFPPLAIRTGKIKVDGMIHMRGNVSSQYLSALLMALPLAGRRHRRDRGRADFQALRDDHAQHDAQVRQRGDGQRLALLRRTGLRLRLAHEIYVEGDASSASYFLAAAAISGGPVRVTGVGRDSIQGDIAFTEVAGGDGRQRRYRAPTGSKCPRRASWAPVDMDMNHIPDAAMTAAVVALFAKGPERDSQHRQLAGKGNRSHHRHGARAAQVRRDGRRRAGLHEDHAARAAQAGRGRGYL